MFSAHKIEVDNVRVTALKGIDRSPVVRAEYVKGMTLHGSYEGPFWLINTEIQFTDDEIDKINDIINGAVTRYESSYQRTLCNK